MEKIKNANMVWMTVEEILTNCLFMKENRSFFETEEENSKHLFTKENAKKTKRRIKKYTDMFNKTGLWRVCAPMIIYDIKGEEDESKNGLFISDGQGRLQGVLKHNEKCRKNGEPTIDNIPVLLIKDKSYAELLDDTVANNTMQVNWSTYDVFRSEMMKSGDATELFKKITSVQDELGVSDYIAKLILFGSSKASHRENVKNAEISPYSDAIFMAFKRFYEETIPSCCGDNIQIKKIKKNDTAMALYPIFAQAIRVYEANNEDYNVGLKMVLDTLIHMVCNIDRVYKFGQIFNSSSACIKENFLYTISKSKIGSRPLIKLMIKNMINKYRVRA